MKCLTDLTRARRVAPQDPRNNQEHDHTNMQSETGYQISGWTDGYKKQKVQGWNAGEGVKEHNSARGPSAGGSHEAPVKTEAPEKKLGGCAYVAFETPNSERSIEKTSSKLV